MRAGKFDDAVSEARFTQSKYGADLADQLSTAGLQAPAVLIVGPARTASTWLKGTLGKHPHIMVANGEPNVLLDVINGGLSAAISWYSKAENWRGRSKLDATLCDKSPTYFCMPSTTMQILSILFPRMKIIAGQRDEPDRLWSAINHRMKDFHFTDGWINFCKEHPAEIIHQIDAIQFNNHIDRWISAFSSENVLTISFSSITRAPIDSVNRVLRHINRPTIDELPASSRRGIEVRLLTSEKKSDVGTPPDNLIEIIRELIARKV